MKKDIFVRSVEEEIFLKFKARSVERKKTLGEAFNEAMQLWIREHE